ncbi:MAG: rubredoxin [Rhodomicrobium sp.]|nr:rubredoxin [Rhodomicrobium sp.]
MSGHFFAGSFGGDIQKIGDATRLECKICWYVYDPAQGDDYWQIPPGTPFSKLPGHWTCPVCDAAQEGFMVLDEKDA